MLLKQGHTENIRAKAADDLGKQGDRTTIPALAEALKIPARKCGMRRFWRSRNSISRMYCRRSSKPRATPMMEWR